MGTTVLLAGCAAKRSFTIAPVPAWDVVQGLQIDAPDELPERQRRQLDEGWESLKAGALESAAPAIETLGLSYGDVSEVGTVRGFLELRQGSLPAAERFFRDALSARPDYVPAQTGTVLAALAADDNESAFERLTTLGELSPASPLIDRYLPTLQLEVAESRLGRARELRAQQQHEEAAAAYELALRAAPEAGGLFLEAAEAEIAAGQLDGAVEHASRAAELEPDNADAHRALGEAQEASGNVSAAYEAYRRSLELRPGDAAVERRAEALQARYEQENLPPEYDEIRDSERLTREQLAAVVFLTLRDFFDAAPGEERVIATDLGESWASAFIRRVLAKGVMDVYPNHTFQPRGFVRRADLARCLTTAFARFVPDGYRSAAETASLEQSFPDLRSENIHFEAAATAVALGLIERLADGAFDPQRLVSGAEAVDAATALAMEMTR